MIWKTFEKNAKFQFMWNEYLQNLTWKWSSIIVTIENVHHDVCE